MKQISTLDDLLCGPPGNATALAGPSRDDMTYNALRERVETFGRTLAAHGLGRNARVAVVVENGPVAAAAFLCLAVHAVAAPLNPAYGREEFSFYLSDMQADAVIVPEGAATPAREAAEALGIPVLEISEPDTAAGAFEMAGPVAAAPAEKAGPDDLALLLHTSGTTSRPKLVPLSHGNLCASAVNIATVLNLSHKDRCLNVMPLFHIHGIAAALLASLAAGASVYCTSGFNALTFFRDLGEVRATWVTAVPTMYQALLARAPRNREIIARNPLRFLRSSSAFLPQSVFTALEETFQCPVIEAYGMTEAAHQIASNALPPGLREPGSVGLASGPEVAVMDAAGNLYAFAEEDEGAGEVSGEIVIRGANVTAGYLENEKANEEAFAGGWLKTGDLGTVDEDGRFRLTGRCKEIINRGGEKISPPEVEEVLLSHPDIAAAVVFALPDDKRGEDVAAAVVRREGAPQGHPDEREVREHAARVLAPFKVPGRVVFLEILPKGATGKVQRIGLARRLGLVKDEGSGP